MKDDLSAKAVRVSVPASVAADIGGLKKSFASILEHLGCPACCSGHDIRLELQRDVLVSKLDAKAKVTGWAGAARKWRDTPSVAAAIDPRAVANLDGVFAAIDKIADLSGHSACATGCDIFFQMERSLVLDANLKIDEQVMRFG